MGVMECRVKGCKNILCDTWLDDHGYICGSCLASLKTMLELEQVTDKAHVERLISAFYAGEISGEYVKPIEYLESKLRS